MTDVADGSVRVKGGPPGEASDGEDTSAPPTRRRRRRRLLAVAGTALAFVGLLLLGYFPASSAREQLLEGRRSLEQGKAMLAEGDAARAGESFARAEGRFEEAGAAARSPLLRLAAWLPVIRRTPNTIVAIADAGKDVASAGGGLAEAMASLPGGLAALGPRDGAIPLTPIPPLETAVRRAEDLAARAESGIRVTPGTLLIGPVADARRQLLDELTVLHDLLATGRGVLGGLPGFLGQDGPRHYFFGVQNPAEIRGTGGIMGAYAILTIDGGRPTFSPFSPTQDLTDFAPGDVEPPSEDYARNYDQFGGAGFWQNLNMTPHFPWAAQAILAAYERDVGRRLDGVVVADPFAFQTLISGSGPVAIPGIGEVTADDVVDFTTNEAYRRFEDSETRKRVLGDVARAVVQRFLLADDPSPDSIRDLARTASEGHVLVYSTDSEFQEAIERTGAGGAFRSSPGDLLSIVENNAAGNKLDFYTSRSIDYGVRLEDGGTASASVQVSVQNDGPDSGEPEYIIGPYPGVSRAGEVVPILNLYCSSSCRLEDFERDGRREDVAAGTELGYRFFQHYFRIPSGDDVDLAYRLALPQAWEGNDSGGVYRLTFIGQTTIRPTTLRVDIEAPEGMSIVEATEPLRISGNRAAWVGIPSHRMELEVTFRPSLPIRLWRNVLRFLTQPVIRL